MYRHAWNGQELFLHPGGDLIFILDFDPGRSWVRAAYYPSGHELTLTQEEYQSLESADPTDLEGII